MDRNIILLFGGESDERLVSVSSAQSMAQAIGSAKLWFWHKNGEIFDVEYDKLINHKDPFTNEFIPKTKPIFNNITNAISSKASDQHIFLLALHGGAGENGEVQELFERFNRPYTGSNANASRLAFNKIATKECLLGYFIKLAPHAIIETDDYDNVIDILEGFYRSHGPLIIKPVCGGSSIGCFFIRTESEIKTSAAQLHKQFPHKFLAEKLIVGREITVGVIEQESGPIGLPCTEIILDKNRDFDYQGKYLGLGSKEITPADLPENLSREAQRIAVAAHGALSLDGYSRADLILATDGFYFLETNTLPGLSKQSLLPQQLAAAGITMREFLNQQIKLAANRRF